MRDEQIRHIIWRLVWIPIFLFLVIEMLFYIGRLGPGDAVLISLHPAASEETREMIRHELGLDKPLYQQNLDYLNRLVHGDFGESLVRPGQRVMDLIMPRIPYSAPIGFFAVFLIILIGFTVGLFAAHKKGTWLDGVLIGKFLFFSSVPSVIFVQFLIFLFALTLNWLPAKWSGGPENALSAYVVIPLIALVLPAIAGTARVVRTLAMVTLDEKYVTFAKAKGVPPLVIALKYVLRNILLPIVPGVIIALLTVISGSFFVEFLYGIPGTGQFMVQSLFQRDVPVYMAWMTLIAFLSVMGWLIDDIVKPFIDPRVVIAKQKR